MGVWFWILLGIVVVIVIPGIASWFYTWGIAKRLYSDLMVRTSEEKWSRTNSCPEDAEYSEMYNTALSWREAHMDQISEVSITSDGHKLFGEFLDNGSDKSVILVSGRAEGLDYSFYFADPYYQSGYNVLCIDVRCHGKSDGKFNALGIKEYVDLQNWARFLEKEKHTRHVVMQGICIGGAACINAVTHPGCPDVIKAIVVEGLYKNFGVVFRQRCRTGHHPTFPVAMQFAMFVKKYSGVDMVAEGPHKYVSQVKLPILFIHGEEDISSVPKEAKVLFANCGSPRKKMVWLPKGAHSHLRICNTKEYDAAVRDFLTTL